MFSPIPKPWLNTATYSKYIHESQHEGILIVLILNYNKHRYKQDVAAPNR